MGVMDKVGVRVKGEGYVRGEMGDVSGNLEIKMVESYFSGQVAIVSPSIVVRIHLLDILSAVAANHVPVRECSSLASRHPFASIRYEGRLTLVTSRDIELTGGGSRTSPSASN